ncbi:MAG: hypothetical protein JXB35_14385 [Anaerolineae bacterium]|nr:hypothetical protein [Anaerolineae bacterium]
MNDYRSTRSGLVQGAQDVLTALGNLRVTLAVGDASDVVFASEALAMAADSYLGQTTKFSRSGFDERAAMPPAAMAEREQLTTEMLTSALVDLEVANALIAAGIAVGETEAPALAQPLEMTTAELDDTVRVVATPMQKGVGFEEPVRRFQLDEVPEVAAVETSASLPAAKTAYDTCLADLLKALVSETKKVLEGGFKGVEDLDEKALDEAIEVVGQGLEDIPKIGKLVSKGLTAIVETLDKLTGILGEDAVKEMQKKAKELIDQITSGAALETFLKTNFGTDATTKMVQEWMGKTPADIVKIDGGRQQLLALQTRFAELTAVMLRIIKGLNTAKKFLNKLLPEATTLLLFGAFYIVTMDIAVLSGMDYADTTTLVIMVPGVRKISEATLV